MASTATVEPQSSNSIARIFGAIVSPVDTFNSIAKKPTWLAPVVLSCIVAVAMFGVFSRKVGWQRVVEQNIQNNAFAARQLENQTPEARQASINMQAKIMPYGFYGGSVVGAFLGTLILAAIFLGLFKLGFGAELDLKTSMGVVAYAFVPRIIYMLLGILVIVLKDPTQVNIQNLLASNPGALLSSETARWLVVLATQFDFFAFWMMLLLALGFHAASPKKISTGGAFAGIFGLWAVWVILVVGVTAAIS